MVLRREWERTCLGIEFREVYLKFGVERNIRG